MIYFKTKILIQGVMDWLAIFASRLTSTIKQGFSRAYLKHSENKLSKMTSHFLTTLHWQTKHWLLGLRPGHSEGNGPQEGDYSAWVAWEKGKVETRMVSQGAQLSLSSGLPRHISSPPVAHYLQGALA